MLRLLLLISFLALSSTVASAQDLRYQLVLLSDPTPTQLRLLQSLDNDHVHATPDGLRMALTIEDVERLRSAGASVRVVIDDLERFYSERAAESLARSEKSGASLLGDGDRPVNFSLGSVGGYYTLDESDTALARMHSLYPSLASAPIVIGRSIEGRDILAIRISARPGNDTTVPEVLFDALHHAREPAGMMSLHYTIWSLLEKYGSDPEATYLLDNRALYFVPIVNPDGYRRNLEESPTGGGMWRRNMRAGGDSAVDINRNYGPREYWDRPNGGSSEDPMASTYRGPEPFSEPETRALRDFVLSRRFAIALNHHTYSNLLIYPFDWTTRVPEDSTYYRVASRELAATAGFAPGNDAVTVGYNTRGTSDEWMYDFGREGGKLVSWTPEVGNDIDGFWPAPERIVPIARDNHRMNTLAAWAAGAAPRITSVERVAGYPSLRVTITNIGREPMDTTAFLRLSDGHETYSGLVPKLASLESTTITIAVPDSAVGGTAPRATLTATIAYDGGATVREFRVQPHVLETIFSEDFEGAVQTSWSLGAWGVEAVSERGRVISDSPYIDYIEDYDHNILELKDAISLEGYSSAELSFDASYVIQARDHDATIEIRRDNDPVWKPIGGEYMQLPLYDTGSVRGHLRGDQRQWHRYSVNLDEYAGSRIRLRVKMSALPSIEGRTFDGVKIDDIRIVGSKPVKTGVAVEDDNSMEMAVTPNPFTNTLAITLHEEGTIELVDMLGRVVRSSRGRSVTFDTGDLPSGGYVVVARVGERVERRVVVR